MGSEPRLELVLVFEAFFFHSLLALGTLLPAASGALVAAAVDVDAREDVNDLVKDLLEEG